MRMARLVAIKANPALLTKAAEISAKVHAFHLEASTLLEASFELELDRPTCADNALPRQSIAALVEQLRHVAVIERISRSGSHLAVSSDLPARDLADRLPK